MASEASVTLRVDKSMIESADGLCNRIDERLRMGGALTRAAVLRMALERGLQALRDEYPDEPALEVVEATTGVAEP
jgi:hypothetical protein